MDENVGLIILAGFVIVSFTIRQIVKYRCDKKIRSRKIESVLSVILVSVITSFLVTVMLLRGYSNRLTEMLETFFNKEGQAREELRKLVLDTMDRIANKYK